jgi:hypothetical protein
MQEQVQSPSVVLGPAPGGGIFDESDGPGGVATVASGVYAEQIPVVNSSVGEIRRRFADRFDIDPRSQAVIDGQDVGDDIVVRAGQVLMFTHRAGEKGRGTTRCRAFPVRLAA